MCNVVFHYNAEGVFVCCAMCDRVWCCNAEWTGFDVLSDRPQAPPLGLVFYESILGEWAHLSLNPSPDHGPTYVVDRPTYV